MFFRDNVINERYKLESLVARGGMGEVWRCRDITLDRVVALKTVNPEHLASNPDALSILKDEAKTGAALLGHPNVVSILDLGKSEQEQENPVYFIVMEYVDGMSLGQWLQSVIPKLDAATAFHINLFISWEICKAIGYAHRNKILHRDIKPLNVFLSRYGVTKIGDFGLARFVEAVTRTHTVWRAMSPAYAAPEQWHGKKATTHTDIYQLGCTLYHLFLRQLPFDHPGLPALMNAHLNEIPKPPSKVDANIPESLSAALMSAMAKKTEDRIELWKLRDVLSEEIRGKYSMTVDVHGASDEVRKHVAEITDFEEAGLKQGPYPFDFPDFSEVLAEAMELALHGITGIKVQRLPEATIAQPPQVKTAKA